ncbi:IS21 family transposase [Neisseria musculi]|uniref:Uncharacterized protein n=2 Tax=Neisseria musculi TaxID=1815583 RepID=A0A7H1M867_9NEIS|nr:IS21 family transposase [Neisseria musculi]QNT57832.1 putative iSPsy4, transposase [Neisseria musculi]
MLNQETVAAIKALKQQGKSIQGMTKELGLSRNTVKKYLPHKDCAQQYQRVGSKPGKPDPFKDYIRSRIEAAAPGRIPAAVPYREILETGFQGKVGIVSDYAAILKPKPDNEPALRFEIKPGRQMQADFTIIRRGGNPPKAFAATLGYSRASCVRFYDNGRTEARTDGLCNSFELFCGMAHKVLFDNAKTVMIQRDACAEDGRRLNPVLPAAANGYGFLSKICRHIGLGLKSRVELFKRYLKSGFIMPLQATLRSSGLLSDVQTADGCIGKRLSQTADARVHGTTGKIPTSV